jgi:hypothetical protein
VAIGVFVANPPIGHFQSLLLGNAIIASFKVAAKCIYARASSYTALEIVTAAPPRNADDHAAVALAAAHILRPVHTVFRQVLGK